jgi:hypothetical protein
MAKLQLGKAPVSFKRIVKISLLNGETADVEMSFKYVTKMDYAKSIDVILEKAITEQNKYETETAAAKKIFDEAELAKHENDNSYVIKEYQAPMKKMADSLKEANVESVNYILDIADGWDLPDEFNKKNVAAMIDEHAGAAEAIGNSYRIAVLEGRLKN